MRKEIIKQINKFIDEMDKDSFEEYSVDVEGVYQEDGHWFCKKCFLCVECGDCECKEPKKLTVTIEFRKG